MVLVVVEPALAQHTCSNNGECFKEAGVDVTFYKPNEKFPGRM